LQKNIFISLFETYQLPLYRYLLQMTRNEETAEELLQETFYRAMVSLKVENMNQAKAWLFKVARNLYIDQLRKAEAEERMLEKVKAKQTGISSLGNPQQQLEKKWKQKELEQILSMLPERMRTILYLREIQGFTYKELEIMMNLTESQVKVTLHRARSKFRQLQAERKEEGAD